MNNQQAALIAAALTVGPLTPVDAAPADTQAHYSHVYEWAVNYARLLTESRSGPYPIFRRADAK